MASETDVQGHQHSRTGIALLWSAVVACPCHWPWIILGLFGGTLIGTYLRTNFVLVITVATAYFILAMALGLWLLRRGRVACQACRSRRWPSRQ
jgi:hypothetical protein